MPYETILFVGVHVGKGVLVMVLVLVIVGVKVMAEEAAGNCEPNTMGVGNVCVE